MEEELLDDRDAIAEGIIASLDEETRQLSSVNFAQMIDELLTTKDDLLGKLIRDHDEYLRLLNEVEVANNELISRTEESEAFIDERVLWIRSSEPIGVTHFSQAWAELRMVGRNNAMAGYRRCHQATNWRTTVACNARSACCWAADLVSRPLSSTSQSNL